MLESGWGHLRLTVVAMGLKTPWVSLWDWRHLVLETLLDWGHQAGFSMTLGKGLGIPVGFGTPKDLRFPWDLGHHGLSFILGPGNLELWSLWDLGTSRAGDLGQIGLGSMGLRTPPIEVTVGLRTTEPGHVGEGAFGSVSENAGKFKRGRVFDSRPAPNDGRTHVVQLSGQSDRWRWRGRWELTSDHWEWTLA